MKNKHLGLRLGIAFAVLIAILVGIGELGLRRMKEVDDTLRDIAGRRMNNVRLVREAMTLSNRNSRITMELFLLQDRAQIGTLLAERSENTKKISAFVAEIQGRCESEKEKRLLAVVEEARKPYVESYLRALHLLVDERKHEAAVAVMVNETLPALLKYHAAWDDFVAFQKTELDTAAKQAEMDSAKARRLASLLITLAVGVALGIAVMTTRQAQESLKNSENKYRVLFEESADANWLMDEKGFLDCNPAALQMFGYSAEAEMKHPADISPPNQPDGTPSRVAAEQHIASAFLKGEERFEWLHQRKNGNVFPAEVCLTSLTLSGRPTLLATVRDITERRQKEKELRLTKFSVEHASDAIFWIEPDGHIVYVNETSCRSLGYSREELLCLSLTDFDPAFPKEAWEAFLQELKGQGAMSLESQHRTKQGNTFPVEITVSYREFDGKEYAFAFVRDITARKLAEEKIQVLAFSDALTGLPNRRLLQDRLTQALASARRQKGRVALLFLDLDRFKNINDSLGHSVGDLLLQEVAGRLKNATRELDTVARVGGDEFLIVLTGLKDVTDAAVAAERIMDAIIGEYTIQVHALNITCSLGISIFPEHGTDAETLIKNADTAMYSAKEGGRNGFRFFTVDINAQAVERLTLENSLQMALHRKELFLMYQPQVDMATGKIVGLEALLRWQHPELGLVPPDKFIRIAENSGQIMAIGEWVFRTACSQARKWQEARLPPVRVAVNVSAVQFRRPGFCEQVRTVLRETGLAPQYLELELTESLLLADADMTLSVIQQLRAMGLSLAIDDFGTGYSSFSYLKQFRVGRLKIDRSFIRDVAANPDDAAITTAIISMAKSLHLKVIAEGVENEAQMTFLRAHHCDEIQGFYFSKPLAVDKVADKLRSHGSEPQARSQATGAQS